MFVLTGQVIKRFQKSSVSELNKNDHSLPGKDENELDRTKKRLPSTSNRRVRIRETVKKVRRERLSSSTSRTSKKSRKKRRSKKRKTQKVYSLAGIFKVAF